MLRDAIEKILELGQPNIIKLHEKEYSCKAGNYIGPPLPETIRVRTLTGFMDAIKHYVGELNSPIIHVVTHEAVTLLEKTNEYGEPPRRLMAFLDNKDHFVSGKTYTLEQFNILLQAGFETNADVEALLKIVGNVSNGDVYNYSDDGISQQVNIKSGAQYKKSEIPNPVTLKPFRTFREIDQPSSLFIFRMSKVPDGGIPNCTLFPADGDRWKDEAMFEIKKWFETKEIGLPVVA